MRPYLSRIEGSPPKRNAARSNRAGRAKLSAKLVFGHEKIDFLMAAFFFFTANMLLYPFADFKRFSFLQTKKEAHEKPLCKFFL